MEQLTIEGWLTANPDHRGKTYDRKLYQKRLNKQTKLVFDQLAKGGWWTLARLSAATGAPEASVSARIRDLRRVELGGWTVKKERVAGKKGLWQYKLVRPESEGV